MLLPGLRVMFAVALRVSVVSAEPSETVILSLTVMLPVLVTPIVPTAVMAPRVTEPAVEARERL